ncbi:MAG: hypothetical protein ACFCU5_20230 [Pleurocapsa sp.]
MSADLIIAIASVAIIWLLFSWSINVLKVSIKTTLTVGAIILILQIAFGIQSEEIWQAVTEIIKQIREFITNIKFG